MAAIWGDREVQDRDGGSMVGTGELERALVFGPLSEALWLSRHAQGLSLDNVVARLAQRGLRVSRATLSAWERGRHQPERRSSLRALRALEEEYGHPPGSLSRLVGAPRLRGIHAPASGPITAEVRRLQRELKLASRARTISVHDTQTISDDRRHAVLRSRQVIRAEAADVDRYVLVQPGRRSAITARAIHNCVVRGVREIGSGLVVVEIDLGRSLTEGETFAFEYEVASVVVAGEVTEARRITTLPADTAILEVRFGRAGVPVRVDRIDGARGPDVDPGGSTHIIEQSVAHGSHIGLRWRWS